MSLAALTLALTLAAGPKPFDFFGNGPYDGSIPKPEAILGYQPGERHTVFRDQERVVYGIAEKAKARMRVIAENIANGSAESLVNSCHLERPGPSHGGASRRADVCR